MSEHFIDWSDEYSVGIRLIDNDHKELLATLNELSRLIEEDAPVKSLQQITTQLIRYAQEHFAREEQLMAEYNYPDLKAHRQKHHDFVRMVYAIRKIELDKPDELDFTRLRNFLIGWLRRHIMGADQDYIPYLKGGYGRRSSDWISSLSRDEAGPDTAEIEEEVAVTIHVKFSAVATLRRCAQILNHGGDEASAIERLTDPVTAMSLDDAMDIARIVLRQNSN